MSTIKSAALLILLVSLTTLSACQTGHNSVGPTSTVKSDMASRIEDVEGPMDGLPAIRFIYFGFLPPRINSVDPQTNLAVSGTSLGEIIGNRGSKKTTHTVVGANDFRVSLAGAEKCAVVQDGNNRCWAACVLMVSKVCGFNLISGRTGAPPTQEELSRHLTGSSRDEPAKLCVIIRALNPQLEASLVGQLITIGAPIATQSTDRMLLDMCAGSPAIIGLDMGGFFHAYVVIGARYSWLEGGQTTCGVKRFLSGSQDCFTSLGLDWAEYAKDAANLVNAMAIREVTVIDPADGQVRVLTGADLVQRCRFIMTPQLGAEILSDRHNVKGLDLQALQARLEKGNSKSGVRGASGGRDHSLFGEVLGNLIQ